MSDLSVPQSVQAAVADVRRGVFNLPFEVFKEATLRRKPSVLPFDPAAEDGEARNLAATLRDRRQASFNLFRRRVERALAHGQAGCATATRALIVNKTISYARQLTIA